MYPHSNYFTNSDMSLSEPWLSRRQLYGHLRGDSHFQATAGRVMLKVFITPL